MKTNKKNYQNKKSQQNFEKKTSDEWKISVKQVLKGGCMINGDASVEL